MNNPNNRATRAIVASGSLLAIIFMGVPWVDEYLELRRGAAELGELEIKLVEAQQRREQEEARLKELEQRAAQRLKDEQARLDAEYARNAEELARIQQIKEELPRHRNNLR